MPKSLRSATSIVGEEGFGEQVVANRGADGIADGTADGTAEGEDCNGFTSSKAIGEGSVGSGGGRSASEGC